jgi:hypothetical protein
MLSLCLGGLIKRTAGAEGDSVAVRRKEREGRNTKIC